MPDRIFIRFNTKAESNNPYIWRVFINDKEFFATNFKLIGEMSPITTTENGVTKYNVGCLGSVTWEGSTAIVKSD